MKKYNNYKIIICVLTFVMIMTNVVFSATVIKKEDAEQFSRKSDYAQELDTEKVTTGEKLESGNVSYNTSNSVESEKFVCVTAKKKDNTYINEWSNYKLTLEGKYKNAMEFYDFNNRDSKFDFGVYWPDWSRLAIYYTTLARDIDQVAQVFAHGKGTPRSVVVGGEVYRYVQEAVEYPYGVEYYDYYLRNVDGKLMVIECFHEKDTDVAPTYIERIEKYNG